MKKCIQNIIASFLIAGFVIPVQAFPQQQSLASFMRQLQKEVGEFKECVISKGENCDPKRKRIYKIITVIIAIIAAVTVVSGVYYFKKGSSTQEERGVMSTLSTEIKNDTLTEKKLDQLLARALEIRKGESPVKVGDKDLKRQPDVVKFVLNENLKWAAFEGRDKIVELLLNKGADVAGEYKDSKPLLFAIIKGDYKTVELLLDRGAEINSRFKSLVDKSPPLMIAAENGHDRIVELLLNRGAEINKLSKTGLSALMIAAENGHDTIVTLLLNRGADVNISKHGLSAIGLANRKLRDPSVDLEKKARLRAILDLLNASLNR